MTYYARETESASVGIFLLLMGFQGGRDYFVKVLENVIKNFVENRC